MQVILSLLVCTINKRKPLFDLLKLELDKQINDAGLHGYIEIISKCDNCIISIGAKRNLLLNHANGKYLCFVDDDDWIDSEYISIIMSALESDPDCVNMLGVMNTDGFSQRRFEHSINNHHYFERNGVYYRPPGHLNPIRSSIAKQFKFPEKNFGEDAEWSMQLIQSGLLLKEVQITKVLYHYRYSTKK